MSLYKKHRPSSFSEVRGNESTIEYLIAAFERELEGEKSFPHTILLHGPTGCGKTTIARIIANELDCSDLNLKELNMADFRGIDTARGIIKNSKYKPIGGKARVWIIDEAHKMTPDAQNAMLKLLEDTPDQSYFILCTTDPNKLLSTVRGRCIDLKVSPLSDKQMFRLLRTVAKAEGNKLKQSVYDAIIEGALGHSRNALQILEKVLNVPEDKQVAAASYSAAELNQSIELCRALLAGDAWKKVSAILNGLKDQEAESIRRHVLGYSQSVLLKGKNDKAAQIIEEFFEPLYDIGYPGLVYYCYCVKH